jgi:hypothetical protein
MIVKPVANETNPLWNYFLKNQGRLIHKWHHYFDIYHNHFARCRGQPVTILEIGVYHGGSLKMWEDYFGPSARIYGVDIDPRCKTLEEGQSKIIIGDQSDRGFLRKLRAEVGTVDILIDDGGHTMEQQINTFEELYSCVAENGVYLAEDLHTSYWKPYGGGYKKKDSFIEYAKGFIDRINAWHSADPKADSKLKVDDFTRSATGLHFYDSILVIEKQPNRTPPVATKTGQPSFETG